MTIFLFVVLNFVISSRKILFSLFLPNSLSVGQLADFSFHISLFSFPKDICFTCER